MKEAVEPVEEQPIQWGSSISALCWAYEQQERIGGYARPGIVPAGERGVGLPWHEVENLALTITGTLHQLDQQIAAQVLAACCVSTDMASQAVEWPPLRESERPITADYKRTAGQPLFQRAVQQLTDAARGQCETTAAQDRSRVAAMAFVAMLRLRDSVQNPKHSERSPPQVMLGKAIGIKRSSLHSPPWRHVMTALEETAERLKNQAAGELADRLWVKGIVSKREGRGE